MPIRFSKGFIRRKSSGNVLEEVENPPEPSFRVFERHPGRTKSFDGSTVLNNGASSRPSVDDPDNIFAGLETPRVKSRNSGATRHSVHTDGLYDSSSSARLSSSSTLPSSTDTSSSQKDNSRGFHDIPVPPPPTESHNFHTLRAAGRTLSFGMKATRNSTPPLPPAPDATRDRTMTGSSASTATPPKLLDSDLQLGNDDSFGSIFDGLDKRKSTLHEQRSSKALPHVPKEEKSFHLAPINVDRSKAVEPSPYSSHSGTSEDALIGSVRAEDVSASRPNISPSYSRQAPTVRKPLASTNSMPLPFASSTEDQAFRSLNSTIGRRQPSPFEDADAKLVKESTAVNRRNTQPPLATTPGDNVDEDTPLFVNEDIVSSARLASQYEDKRPPSSANNKVMTPAQFERYRQQMDLTRQQNDGSDSEKSETESDYEEEDDEAEEQRKAALQRRKQEAHLSVYRQQMMKVIGEQAPNLLNTSSAFTRASTSTPNLLGRTSTLGLPMDTTPSGKVSDTDDDEDVPLGILAAHGFPNKNRPPTRLTTSTSIPNLRNAASASPGSVSGDNSGSRGSLPVFARNLPRDPYYGAGLVNASNRESLAMGGGAPAYGSPNAALPPGGLVGVIATEERARAMRRGSPQTPGQDGGVLGVNGPVPGMMPKAHSMGNLSQMAPSVPWGVPGMLHPNQALSPGEQAQLQMSQQMTQMMQMQMQWMQQMMQMQGIQNGPPAAMNHQFLSPQASNANIRPMSLASHSSMNLPTAAPQVDQRTLSLLDPNMSRWNLNRPPSMMPDLGNRPSTGHAAGYAPSIAPSERSNVGMASRYRPVSTAVQEPTPSNQSSTFTTSTLKAWNDENQRPLFGNSPNMAGRKSTSMATVTVRPVNVLDSQPPASKARTSAGSDDDDDEGWTEMMKQRERKKSNWKGKKDESNLGELAHLVH